MSGAGTVRGELAALDIRQWLNVPEAVTVNGRLTGLVDATRFEAVATWDTLTLPVTGIGSLRASGGHLELAGWLEDWQARLAADLRAPDLPAARVRATVHGNDRVVHFDDARFDGDFGTLAAQGELALGSPQRLRLTMAATGISTAAFRPGLEGRLSTRADLDAEFPGVTRLRFRQLDGRLMGRPLAGGGEVEYENDLWRSCGNVSTYLRDGRPPSWRRPAFRAASRSTTRRSRTPPPGASSGSSPIPPSAPA